MKVSIKLFLSVLLVGCVSSIINADVYFYDGFEHGDLSGWDAPQISNNCDMMADTGAAKRGNYAFKSIDNSPGTPGYTNYASIVKHIRLDEFYMRFYIYFPTGQLSCLSDGHTRILLTIYGKDKFIKNADHDLTFSVGRNAADDYRFSMDFAKSHSGVQENTWYCVEMKMPACTSNATVQWWINGVEKESFTKEYAAYGSWGTIWLGLGWINNDSTALQTMYIDEVVISDSYIGPITQDPYPGNFQFAKADFIAKEDCTNTAVTVRRMGGSSGAVSVTYTTSDGTAQSGSDYTYASGVLNWADGDMADKTFTVYINNDTDTEDVETINLALTGPTGSAELGGYDTAVLSITDNDDSGIIPNPLVSRGKPAYASCDFANAGKVVDGVYTKNTSERWTPDTTILPQWIAINVGSGYQKLLLSWNITAEIMYLPCTVAWPYYGPKDYTIQTSANSTNGYDGTWETVVNVSDNWVRSRAHSFPFAGKTWVRMNIVGKNGTTTWGFDEIDIHDVSNGCNDTVFFWGDSITQNAYTRESSKSPAYAQLVNTDHTDYFPAMINGGTGGEQGQHAVNNIDYLLEINPDMKYWFITYGANDAVYGWGTHTIFFKKALQTMADKLRAAGRIPIIGRTPYSTSPGREDLDLYAAVVDEVTTANGLITGPDFYNWFLTYPGQLSDGTHPTDEGCRNMNSMWSDVMDSYYAAGWSSDGAHHIECMAVPDNIPANGGSASTIYALIRDANGILVDTATNEITFSIEGEGTLELPVTVNAVDGVASITMYSTTLDGGATVQADADGLLPGSAFVNTFQSTGIFSDNFENWSGGIGQWDGRTEETGCSATRTTDVKKSGNYSLMCQDTSNSQYRCYLTKSLPDSTSCYMRFYFYLPEGFYAINGGSDMHVKFFTIKNDVGNDIILSGFKSGIAEGIFIQCGGPMATYYTNMQEEMWHYVEILAPGQTAESEIRWWVNDVEASPIAVDLSAASPWNGIDCGITFETVSSNLPTLYIDELIISDSFIGKITEEEDATPPTDVSVVRDGTSVDIDTTSSATELSANWEPSFDPETGIRRYWYAIGTSEGATDVLDWTDNGTARSVTKTGLTLTNGSVYYVSVKAENMAGLQSTPVSSDGQTVNAGTGGDDDPLQDEIRVQHPNPYPLSNGGLISFQVSGMEGNSRLRIFTISGRLVKIYTLDAGTEEVDWDLLNEDGNDIRPGLYLYALVDAGGNRRTGKVVITR